jgi:hypothetical protein
VTPHESAVRRAMLEFAGLWPRKFTKATMPALLRHYVRASFGVDLRAIQDGAEALCASAIHPPSPAEFGKACREADTAYAVNRPRGQAPERDPFACAAVGWFECEGLLPRSGQFGVLADGSGVVGMSEAHLELWHAGRLRVTWYPEGTSYLGQQIADRDEAARETPGGG